MAINFAQGQDQVTPEQVEALFGELQEVLTQADNQEIKELINQISNNPHTSKRMKDLPYHLRIISEQFNTISNGTMVLQADDILNNAILGLTDKDNRKNRLNEIIFKHTGYTLNDVDLDHIYMINYSQEGEYDKGQRIRLTNKALQELYTTPNVYNRRYDTTTLADWDHTDIMRLLANSGLLLLCGNQVPNDIKRLIIMTHNSKSEKNRRKKFKTPISKQQFYKIFNMPRSDQQHDHNTGNKNDHNAGSDMSYQQACEILGLGTEYSEQDFKCSFN